MYLRMIARKKIGIEIPISDPTRVAWSKIPPYRFAAKKPSGMPTTDREDHRRDRELDRRREALPDLVGDRAVRGDADAEVAVDASSSGSRSTAAQIGLSSPYRSRYAWTSCGVARSPSSASAGLPGQRPDPEEDEDRDPEQNRDRAAAAGGRRNEALRRPPAALLSFLLAAARRPVSNGSVPTGLGDVALAPTSRIRVPAASARTALPAGTS